LRPIAFLISSDMVAGASGARADQFEFEREFAELDPACRAAGFALEPVVWDGGIDPARFEAFVIGTAWDYVEKRGAFLERLTAFARQRGVDLE